MSPTVIPLLSLSIGIFAWRENFSSPLLPVSFIYGAARRGDLN